MMSNHLHRHPESPELQHVKEDHHLASIVNHDTQTGIVNHDTQTGFVEYHPLTGIVNHEEHIVHELQAGRDMRLVARHVRTQWLVARHVRLVARHVLAQCE